GGGGVTAIDAEVHAESVSWTVVGGAAYGKPKITSGGALSFVSAPNFENPTDVGGNNIYNVTVRASDGNGGTTDQEITVTVTPLRSEKRRVGKGGRFRRAEEETASGGEGEGAARR